MAIRRSIVSRPALNVRRPGVLPEVLRMKEALPFGLYLYTSFVMDDETKRRLAAASPGETVCAVLVKR